MCQGNPRQVGVLVLMCESVLYTGQWSSLIDALHVFILNIKTQRIVFRWFEVYVVAIFDTRVSWDIFLELLTLILTSFLNL